MRMVRERLAALDGRIGRAQQDCLQRESQTGSKAEGLLQTLSPLAVLNRGYALVFDEAGVLVREASAAPDGGLITTRFAHSTLTSRVLERKSPQTNHEKTLWNRRYSCGRRRGPSGRRHYFRHRTCAGILAEESLPAASGSAGRGYARIQPLDLGCDCCRAAPKGGRRC
jgi:hypothetical protein